MIYIFFFLGTKELDVGPYSSIGIGGTNKHTKTLTDIEIYGVNGMKGQLSKRERKKSFSKR